ncbi:glycosyltransferase family 4 protein [Algoriphagus sp. C2-6-M1]|uniref:glycosyltransferase family 4 protein n=1 Tax=Algoriphagus persicinus TaxID=3108754 RepID=UPI002B36AC1E|nr:glycosyltransferase family 4 protein [Algoriphagus sp. C2-6-M1]MEB2779609.1 glycosyltransferase family 4 protein [Algoriphagus sp. C2-6-M1]
MKIFAYNDFILKKNKGKIYADDSHILFIKATCKTYFDESQLGSRCIETEESGHYFFTEKREEVLVFPFYSSVSEFLKKPSLFSRSKELLQSAVTHFDVFWVTWPHPISFLILLLIGRKKPVVLFMRQNLEALIQVRYSGIQKWAGLSFTKFLYWYAEKFHANALLITVGDEMYERFNGKFIHSSYISDSIVSEQVRMSSREMDFEKIKLLFVGRLEPEKGLPDLFRAVQLLNKTNNTELTIVGEGDQKDQLINLREELNLHSKIKFTGYKPFGEELFELYRNHHFLMISSYSEGLPKIINEARAFALPVISTKVGGIAKALQHEKTCLFVSPGKPEELSRAVVRLIGDPTLYHSISANLSDEFSGNSLEYWSKIFADLVHDYCNLEYAESRK